MTHTPLLIFRTLSLLRDSYQYHHSLVERINVLVFNSHFVFEDKFIILEELYPLVMF